MLDPNQSERAMPAWLNKFTQKDIDSVNSNWILELQSILPNKESVNYLVGIDKVMEINQKGGRLTEMKEKVYVYADFLPPAVGKHNVCLLYNTVHVPKKALYHIEAPVRQRE